MRLIIDTMGIISCLGAIYAGIKLITVSRDAFKPDPSNKSSKEIPTIEN